MTVTEGTQFFVRHTNSQFIHYHLDVWLTKVIFITDHNNAIIMQDICAIYLHNYMS